MYKITNDEINRITSILKQKPLIDSIPISSLSRSSRYREGTEIKEYKENNILDIVNVTKLLISIKTFQDENNQQYSINTILTFYNIFKSLYICSDINEDFEIRNGVLNIFQIYVKSIQTLSNKETNTKEDINNFVEQINIIINSLKPYKTYYANKCNMMEEVDSVNMAYLSDDFVVNIEMLKINLLSEAVYKDVNIPQKLYKFIKWVIHITANGICFLDSMGISGALAGLLSVAKITGRINTKVNIAVLLPILHSLCVLARTSSTNNSLMHNTMDLLKVATTSYVKAIEDEKTKTTHNAVQKYIASHYLGEKAVQQKEKVDKFFAEYTNLTKEESSVISTSGVLITSNLVNQPAVKNNMAIINRKTQIALSEAGLRGQVAPDVSPKWQKMSRRPTPMGIATSSVLFGVMEGPNILNMYNGYITAPDKSFI